MEKRITGKTNPFVQQVRKLRDSRKYRYQTRRFLADGTKLVQEALRWGAGVETVLLRDGVDFPMPEGVPVIRVSEALMAELSRMDTPQGVLAVCAMPEPGPLEPRSGSLILDGIQDPGNLGTILRTADALEVPVYLADGCADPYSEKTVRASMGAVFRTPPVQATTQALLEACRSRALPLLVTALTEDAKDLRTLSPADCVCVIGSEGQGIRPAFLEAAQIRAVIPMSARCESLNAAVAAAILMWQMRR